MRNAQENKVASLTGAKITDITEQLTNDDDHYRQVFICVYTNNCAGEINVDQLVKQYEDLVLVAGEKVPSTDNILISSVPPRTDKVERQLRVEELGAVSLT